MNLPKRQQNNAPVQITFAKEAILEMKQFKNRKDLLGVLLEAEQYYSIGETNALLKKFMKGGK